MVIASKDLALASRRGLRHRRQADRASTSSSSPASSKPRRWRRETEPSNDGGVRWDITDSTGETDTSYGPTRRILVEAGEATVTGSLGTATTSVPVTVEAGKTVAVDVVLGAGRLVLRGKRSEEATDFDNGIAWDVTSSSGETVTTYGGEVTLDLAAGDYTVKATLGEATAEVHVSVPAGKTVEQLVVVATGKVIAHAYFAEGGPVVTAGPRFDMLSPEPGTDGNRRTIATSYEDGSQLRPAPGELRASGDIPTRQPPRPASSSRPVRRIEVVGRAQCRTARGHRARRRLPRTLRGQEGYLRQAARRSPIPTARAGSSPCLPATTCSR